MLCCPVTAIIRTKLLEHLEKGRCAEHFLDVSSTTNRSSVVDLGSQATKIRGGTVKESDGTRAYEESFGEGLRNVFALFGFQMLEYREALRQITTHKVYTYRTS